MSREVLISRTLGNYFFDGVTDIIMHYMRINLWEYDHVCACAGYISQVSSIDELLDKKIIIDWYEWNEDYSSIEGYDGDVLHLKYNDENEYHVPVTKDEQTKVIEFLKSKRAIQETI